MGVPYLFLDEWDDALADVISMLRSVGQAGGSGVDSRS